MAHTYFLIAFVVLCVTLIGARGNDNSTSFDTSSNETNSVDLYYTTIPEYLTSNNVDSPPYVVQIRASANGPAYCAGALIGAKWVLTTVTCAPKNNGVLAFFGFKNVFKDQYAMIGSSVDSGHFDGELIKVINHISHPDYNKKTRENNYMMLKLERESKFAPIDRALDGEHYMDYDSAGFVYGWQSSSDTSTKHWSGLMNTTMQWTSDCKNTVDKVYASQFCARGTKSTDACRLSEGSPFLLKFPSSDFLVGIVIYNPGCGKGNTPTLLARESKGQEFMTHTMLFYD